MEPHDCNWRDDIGCINSRCPLHRAMRTLAHNLAWGAALCRAYETPRWRWQPGCGKAAP